MSRVMLQLCYKSSKSGICQGSWWQDLHGDNIQAFSNLFIFGCTSLPWFLLLSVGKCALAFLGEFHQLPSKKSLLCCHHPRVGGKGALITAYCICTYTPAFKLPSLYIFHVPPKLKNLGTSHMFSAGALGLEANESLNIFLGHLRCKVEMMYLQSLLGSGLLYPCTISFCVLFVFFLLLLPPLLLDCLFHPCSACPKKWPGCRLSEHLNSK